MKSLTSIRRTITQNAGALLRKAIRGALHVFFPFPVRRDRLFFESYRGSGYSCNPRYFCEYVNRTMPGRFTCVWSFEEPEKFRRIPGIVPVKKNSLKMLFYRFTARAVIENMADPAYFPARKGQLVINTWHGGGAFKQVGDSRAELQNPVQRSYHELLAKKTGLYLSSSKVFTAKHIRGSYGYRGTVLKSGMPRNDLFFNRAKTESAAARVRAHYDITEETIILYAPTYRGDVYTADAADFTLPADGLLKAAEGRWPGGVRLLVRGHYSIGSSLQTGSTPGITDATDYPDMQELLAAADILITDYSSSIWDFALTKKPCLLYVPDLSEYEKKPGLFMPADRWPGIVCKNGTELFAAIADLDKKQEARKAAAYLERMGSYENGRACERLLAAICNDRYS